MNHDQIEKETYQRLIDVVGKPDEYFEGKICSYEILNKMDSVFLYNIDKNYLKDYFLIKDWVRFSFYNGYILKDFFTNNIYKEIPIENIELIWNAFNENKKEKNGKEKQYYKEKRSQYIPEIISLLLKKSKSYDNNKVMNLLKELIYNLKEEKEEYYLARNCAKLMGDYLTTNRYINNDIFEYLKNEQNIKQLELYLIFHDWQISKIVQKEKLEIIYNMIKEQKPDIQEKQIIENCLEKNAFNMINYIHERYNYIFHEEELQKILEIQKNLYNNDNVKHIIENFNPAILVGKIFVKIYHNYKYSSRKNEESFYNDNYNYLAKRISYEQLNEKLLSKNTITKPNKI